MVRSFRLGKLNIAVAALLILGLALVTLLFGGHKDTAAAASGGIALSSPSKSTSNSSGSKAVKGTRFGARTLRQGMTGADVKVLKSIVRSKRLLSGALNTTFDRPTTSAVRRFQGSANMNTSGVVNKTTARKMIGSLRTSEASWYGPGLWGNGTACGKVTLRPNTIGLANKNLPCGTRVLIGYRGKFVIAPVIDRGPYIAGRTWDLTKAASDAIGLTGAGVGRVRHAVLSRGK
ncbi:MAG: peptidoglycan-binding protein [Solirubrobacterales bacterium]|nr:peptidoglycan-binding protein [Solirubrobacterales bacterium]HRV59406.1 RlpA-like double-psi beta-barrel domain-containing protein [Solirubrobacterales bacterium]